MEPGGNDFQFIIQANYKNLEPNEKKAKYLDTEAQNWFSIAKNKALFQHPLKRSQKERDQLRIEICLQIVEKHGYNPQTVQAFFRKVLQYMHREGLFNSTWTSGGFTPDPLSEKLSGEIRGLSGVNFPD